MNGSAGPAMPVPAYRTTVSHARDARLEDGLRGFFAYRNLGIEGATGGGFGAHVIRAVPGEGAKPEWHRHALAFQMVMVLRGWVRFEYADIGEVMLEPGDTVLQPPGVAHREVAHSEDLEMLEVTAPGDFRTEHGSGP